MPHVTVKMYAGRSNAEKQELSDRISEAVRDVLGYGPESISVGIEDVSPSDWMEKVYATDIRPKEDTLFKRPGYGPLAR
ncbi:4-oxalocrotonate tautomerase [Altericroceibacterium spongiae]|uniref:4-oxalocrotonate tautomerase n=1 Tax=Altericroceibacterium spongiae TaxID=2320269 RepID=A0A420ERK7_9SPHN|nr:tautomerase family protein [Altericroceibacterium spongiae]RKF23315.1 4-oxalocrotonate tautomerase [Altericroceibacterium spongiae]